MNCGRVSACPIAGFEWVTKTMASQKHMVRPTILLMTVSLFAIGCGGGSSSPTTTETDPESAANSSNETAGGSSQSASNGSSEEPDVLVQVRNGQKWIGDIPLDVWYDDPLAVASNTQAVPSADPGNTVAMTPAQPDPMPAETEPEEPAGGGTDWKSIITAAALDKEVTDIRNRLNTDLQSVGTYNRNYLALPPHLATLAVMAGVAKEHPEDFRWKDKAGYIQQLAKNMNADQLRTGAGSFRPLREQFDFFLDIMNGSVPPGLEAAPADEAIPDTTDFGELMKRLEVASKFISVNGGTEEAMKTNAEKLRHEAMVLGAVTKILNREGFGYEGDSGFDEFVDMLVKASQDINSAVESEQFDKFDLARSQMGQACTLCHTDYRG